MLEKMWYMTSGSRVSGSNPTNLDISGRIVS